MVRLYEGLWWDIWQSPSRRGFRHAFLRAERPTRQYLRRSFCAAPRADPEHVIRTRPICPETRTVCKHVLARERTLAEVRDAVGHANVSITSGYLHVAVEDKEVGRLFG